jgi:hypothetical protein
MVVLVEVADGDPLAEEGGVEEVHYDTPGF